MKQKIWQKVSIYCLIGHVVYRAGILQQTNGNSESHETHGSALKTRKTWHHDGRDYWVSRFNGSFSAHIMSLYVHVYMQGPLTLTTYQDWSVYIQSVCIPPVCPLQERHLHCCVNDLPLSLCGCQVGGIFALDVPSNHLPCRLLEPCRLITGEGEIRVVCHLWNIKSLVAA